TVLTYERTINTFRFKDVPGFQMGTAYSVRVAYQYNNVWYPYGQSCIITTAAGATVRVEQEKEVAVSAPIFSVKGYPNPYNAYFVLSLETPSESKVGVRVFDMAGKLIEEKEVEPAMLKNLPLGANWPLGVYNIIVTQDSQVKTIKMVKNE
ncbi:T9SS type A sorting domain-containing protein, partial [Flavobacterium sp.]|uniref:T9SS type A sorting domain-containing protein n=1 Tax=Flavobacterium sp. TaxID=239 RepID=UPI0037C0FCBA